MGKLTNTTAELQAILDQGLLQDNWIAYGGIHVHDASVAQSIPAGVGYTKITAFQDNEDARNCTPDATNDKITISKTGIYDVMCSVNFYSGTNNVTYKGAVFVDGVEIDPIHFQQKVGTGTDTQSSVMVGKLNISSVPVDLDFRVAHDSGSAVNYTVTYANLSITKIDNV